jgi:phage terminase large subunit-like protein
VSEDLKVGCAIYRGDEGVLECAAKVRELASRVGRRGDRLFDPWRFTQAALEFESEGLPAVAFPQTDQRMVPASQRLYDAVVEGRLTHSDDSELNARCGGVRAPRSSRVAPRQGRARTHCIDAVVALAMAVERAEHRAAPAQLVDWV